VAQLGVSAIGLCKERKAWTDAIHKVVEIYTESPDWKRVIIIMIRLIIVPRMVVSPILT
jgi:hypothetical protein